MTSLRLGIDVTDAAGWSRRLARTPDLGRTAFTVRELSESRNDPERLAMVWAVKEAVVKALGTGFAGIGWRGVEVRCPEGRPAAIRLVPVPAVRGLAPTTRILLAVRREPVVVAAVALSPGTGEDHREGHRDDPPVRAAVRTDPAAWLTRAPRAGRAALASAAVRRTAERAARTLVPDTAWGWDSAPGGAPVLRTGDGRRLPVGLSHGAGITAAIVGLPGPPEAPEAPEPCEPPEPPRNCERSTILTIISGDYLLEGVSVHG